LPEHVLDASALLALIHKEPGGEKVRPLLAQAVISAVNFCETLQRLRRDNMPLEDVRLALAPLIAFPVPFDESQAYIAASIHERSRHVGLSFGDCACLALALTRKVAAVTAERTWNKVDVGVRIIRIRE
jgi:PIN domain nuclease of toxin-antitoxin system